jgi:PAS domain S-box-containing protein
MVRSFLRTSANTPFAKIFLFALFLLAVFWGGQVLFFYYFQGAYTPSPSTWLWFSGILCSGLLLAGIICLKIFMARQGEEPQNPAPHQGEGQFPLAHNPGALRKRANELVFLLDQPFEAGAKAKEENSSSAESSPGLRELDNIDFYQDILADIETEERRLTQDEVNKSKRRYRIVSEFASDWTYWQGPQKEILYVSPACEEISGYPPQEFYRSPDLLEAIVFSEDRPLWMDHNQKEMSEKGPGPMEFRILRKNNEIRWVSHFCRPVHDPQGKFLGICSTNRDITSQKRTEEALRIKTEELLRSNAELEQFAYVASHDLQSPLRAISGYLNLLTKRYEDKLDAEGERFIHRTVENVKRMQRLINDLLAYSRLHTRGKPFEPTDCNEVLKEVLEMLHPAIEESGAVIHQGELPTFMADRVQMMQLFQNLIGNGIKFRKDSSPRIHVEARRSGRGWAFAVKDNGIGIDPQYGERIFLIFQRLHTVDQYPGTGIGLAICKKIVERHGGRIWVESRPGEGSTFQFTISERGGKPA